MTRSKRGLRAALGLLSAGALVACGGGGTADSDGMRTALGDNGIKEGFSIPRAAGCRGPNDSPEEALHTAFRFMKETHAHAVKLEGGVRSAEQIRRVVSAGRIAQTGRRDRCHHLGGRQGNGVTPEVVHRHRGGPPGRCFHRGC